jgi:hypothetical protein
MARVPLRRDAASAHEIALSEPAQTPPVFL